MSSHSHSLLNIFLAGALALTSVAGAASPAPASATVASVRYAKPGGATSGTCLSWATACNLQYALTSVAVAGDEIWVAGGVYTPGTTLSATFTLTDGVALYGGFAGAETTRAQRNIAANVTVLSGDIDNNDVKGDNGVVTDTANIQGNNAYHVITNIGVANTAVIDGFTITGGNANGTDPDINGGGMYNSDSSPTLTNVIFSGNFAAAGGGGIYNSGGSPTLTNVTFSGNFGGYYGGGTYNINSSSALTNVTFSGNSAGNYGGGMYNFDGSNTTLINVTFSSNSVTDYGGGMYNINSSSTLTNVTFSGNSADTGSGGGIYNNAGNLTLTNITFSANSAGSGGGIYTDGAISPTVRNTLFVKGAVGENCAGATFAGSSTTNLADDGSCVGSTIQSANIKLGVLGNYGGSTQTIPLLPGSDAIDAGNNAYCPATDQRGVGRGGRCDLGAFEAQRTIYLPLTLKNSRSYFEGPAESEDNDAYTGANGPLRSGRVYSGLFNDEKDYFSVYLDATGTISASATHTRTAVQMQMFYQVADVDHRLMIDFAGKHVEYAADANHLGWYYIYLNAGPEPYLSEPYTLLVTYP